MQKPPFHKKSIPIDIVKASDYFRHRPMAVVFQNSPFFVAGEGQRRRSLYALSCIRDRAGRCRDTPLADLFKLANVLVRPKRKDKKDEWSFDVTALDNHLLIFDYTYVADDHNNDDIGEDVIAIYAESISGKAYLVIEFLDGYEMYYKYSDEITETIEMFIKLFKSKFAVNVGDRSVELAKNIDRVAAFNASNRGKKIPENLIRSFIGPHTYKSSNKKAFPASALFKEVRGGATRRKRRNSA